MSVLKVAPLGAGVLRPSKRAPDAPTVRGFEWFKLDIRPVEKTFPDGKIEFPATITIGKIEFTPDSDSVLSSGAYGVVRRYSSKDESKTIAVKAFFDPKDGSVEKKILDEDHSRCWDAHLIASRWVPSKTGKKGWVIMENLVGTLWDMLNQKRALSDMLLVMTHAYEALKCASYGYAMKGKCLFYTDINMGNIMYATTPRLKGTLIDMGGFYSCAAQNSFVSTFPSPLTYRFSASPGIVKNVPREVVADILEHQQASRATHYCVSRALFCAKQGPGTHPCPSM